MRHKYLMLLLTSSINISTINIPRRKRRGIKPSARIETKGATTMAQTNINIRMDENLKKQFEAFCSDIGMTMTTAFCVFAKAAVRKQKIPFEISTDPFYSESNMAHLRRGIEALNAGKGVEHELIEAYE